VPVTGVMNTVMEVWVLQKTDITLQAA